MTYKLKRLSLFLNDGRLEPAKPSHDKAELRAQIASKDYFALLATRLDQVSQTLSETQKSNYLLLEDTISDLLYMHEFYKIVKKSPG